MKALLAIAAVALLAAGVWIGRATQSAAPTEPRPPTRSAEVPRLPVAHVAHQPTLKRTTPVTPGLAEDLRDPDPRVRAIAIREAARDAVDPDYFLAASRDPDQDVAIAATEALGAMYARGEVPVQELVARATDRSLDHRVRVTALNGFGVVASPEAAATLTQMLRTGNTIERSSAAILLAHQDPAIAVPALIDALGDTHEGVRYNVQEALRGKARGRDFGTDAGAWRAWWQSRSK